MGAPYKMKGSPMQRNFGIGVSPAKNKTGKGAVSLSDARGGRGSLDFWNQTPAETKVAKRRAAREHYVANDNFSKNKKPADFNMKGGKTTTPGFSTTKLAKAKKVIKKGVDVVKKKASRFIPGVGALITGADLLTSKTATATKPVDHGGGTKKSQGEQIKNLLTKHNLKGGN